jgi:membrane-associated phospholipid phosphatase
VCRPLRPLLVLYPLAMGLTLMATGEHYFFDVLLGWMYAGGVMGAWAWWEGRRERVTVRGRSRPPRYRLPAAESGVRVPGDWRRVRRYFLHGYVQPLSRRDNRRRE